MRWAKKGWGKQDSRWNWRFASLLPDSQPSPHSLYHVSGTPSPAPMYVATMWKPNSSFSQSKVKDQTVTLKVISGKTVHISMMAWWTMSPWVVPLVFSMVEKNIRSFITGFQFSIWNGRMKCWISTKKYPANKLLEGILWAGSETWGAHGYITPRLWAAWRGRGADCPQPWVGGERTFDAWSPWKFQLDRKQSKNWVGFPSF